MTATTYNDQQPVQGSIHKTCSQPQQQLGQFVRYSRRGHPKNDRRWVSAVEDERTHQKCCSLEGEDAKDW